MRFLLLEDDRFNSQYGITPELIQEFENADNKRKGAIVSVIANKMEDPYLKNLLNAFRKSCIDYGIDSNKNPFMTLIPKLGRIAKVDAQHDEHVCALIDLSLDGTVSPETLQTASKGDYLLNPSLFHRNVKEFIYTVKAFEIVLNPQKLSKYFHNWEDISIADFFDKSGNIKPAGGPDTHDDTGTIFGTIESWGGADGSNEKRADKKQTADKDSKGIGAREKARIKSAMIGTGIQFLTDIKRPTLGMTVFVYGEAPPKNPRIAMNPNDSTAGYYKYMRGGWEKLADAYD